MSFVLSESAPHLLLHDERTDLGGSQEGISEGDSCTAGVLYACNAAVRHAMQIVNGNASEDTVRLSELRDTITDLDQEVICQRLEVHMQWKVSGLLKALSKKEVPDPGMKVPVTRHYLAILAEDITEKVIFQRNAIE